MVQELLEKLNLTEDTKIKDLLDIDGGFIDYLVNLNPAFKVLENPLVKMVINKLTLRETSDKSGIPLDEIMAIVKERFNK